MAKYKIIPSSRTIVHSPISIGHKAEKGVEAIEFDLTAWVETYGSGTLTVIMRRWGDAIPYPIALEIDENNKATWTLSDIDTAKAGMAYAQLNYIVGDEVVKKSDIYTFRVMDSLTGEGEPPEAYESWLEHLTHIAAQAMAEVLDIEGVVTDKTLTVDGGIADAKATGDALSALKDAVTEKTDKLKADLDAYDDKISAIAESVGSSNMANPSNLEDGGIGSDGSYNSASGYKRSIELVSVKPSTTYAVKGIAFIALYQEDGSFISRLSLRNYTTGTTFETTSATQYVRFVSNIDPNTSPWRCNEGSEVIDEDYQPSRIELNADLWIEPVMDSALENPKKAAPAKIVGDALKKIGYTNLSLSMFTSIGVIGDSFASGYISDGNNGQDYYPLSWIQVLGRDIGATAVNYSRQGARAVTWLESNTWGINKLNNEAANQLYIIALGINDAARGGTLGTIADITSDNTDSFYSYYGRIIRAVKAHAPNAIIMLSTVARWGTGYNNFSNAIRAIGEYYDLAVLDLDENAYFQSEFFSSAQVYNHPIAVNYAGMAKAYKAMIEDALYNNYDAYKTFVG